MARGEDAIGKTVSGAGPKRAQVRKVRRDGWTAKRRATFLEELAASANVTRAAEAARMTTGAAYHLRKRDRAFGEQWAAALDEGYDRLEAALLERSLNGRVEIVVTGNKTIERTVYSDSVALSLLRLHRKSVSERRERMAATRSPAELADELQRRLTLLATPAYAALPAPEASAIAARNEGDA